MISGIMDGHPMDKSVVKWIKRVTHGSQTGPNQGKTQYGIYEFEGEVLKICISAPGAARPTQFQSAPGDSGTLTVWKRA